MKKNLFFFFCKKLFYSRFKANFLGKMRGYPQFSLWIPIPVALVNFFPYKAATSQKNLRSTLGLDGLDTTVVSAQKFKQWRRLVDYLFEISLGFLNVLLFRGFLNELAEVTFQGLEPRRSLEFSRKQHYLSKVSSLFKGESCLILVVRIGASLLKDG